MELHLFCHGEFQAFLGFLTTLPFIRIWWRQRRLKKAHACQTNCQKA